MLYRLGINNFIAYKFLLIISIKIIILFRLNLRKMDMNAIYSKQITEFLRDHKMRFKQINTQGQHGNVGYQGQLNIPGVYANLMM